MKQGGNNEHNGQFFPHTWGCTALAAKAQFSSRQGDDDESREQPNESRYDVELQVKLRLDATVEGAGHGFIGDECAGPKIISVV